MNHDGTLSIYVLAQGWYGQRIVQNIKGQQPSWRIKTHEFSRDIPMFIDDPKEILPSIKYEHQDLILSLGENPVIASLIPSITKATGAKAVIAPIDNSKWLPPGVRRQVSDELVTLGVDAVFPKPFCSLEDRSGNKFIDKFVKSFGKPSLQIELNCDKVKDVKVLRDSPCGSTRYVKRKLIGVKKEAIKEKASLQIQLYPCLASREKDSEYGKPLIHVAAKIIKMGIFYKRKR